MDFIETRHRRLNITMLFAIFIIVATSYSTTNKKLQTFLSMDYLPTTQCKLQELLSTARSQLVAKKSEKAFPSNYLDLNIHWVSHHFGDTVGGIIYALAIWPSTPGVLPLGKERRRGAIKFVVNAYWKLNKWIMP